MGNEQNGSGFKYVFWGILFILVLAFFAQGMWFLLGGMRFFPLDHHGPNVFGPFANWMRTLTMVIPSAVIFVLWVVVVGTLVYRDAKRRGMDPWLWATVAVFIPFFIGVVVYLVVRSNGHVTCGNCGQPIKSDYKLCPHCGQRRDGLCPSCNKPVAPDWKVCPYCMHALERGTADIEGR